MWSAAVPAALRYDPVTNPTGARPTMFDWVRNIYGRDPVTGFGLRPYDNVGVQYGLGALNSGAITTTQFLDLNQGIGGVDQDFNYTASRAVGDAGAIKRALPGRPEHERERRSQGHPGVRHGQLQRHERLITISGTASRSASGCARPMATSGNHVMWRGSSVPFNKAWQLLNMWVSAVKADQSSHVRASEGAQAQACCLGRRLLAQRTRSSSPSRRL